MGNDQHGESGENRILRLLPTAPVTTEDTGKIDNVRENVTGQVDLSVEPKLAMADVQFALIDPTQYRPGIYKPEASGRFDKPKPFEGVSDSSCTIRASDAQSAINAFHALLEIDLAGRLEEGRVDVILLNPKLPAGKGKQDTEGVEAFLSDFERLVQSSPRAEQLIGKTKIVICREAGDDTKLPQNGVPGSGRIVGTIFFPDQKTNDQYGIPFRTSIAVTLADAGVVTVDETISKAREKLKIDAFNKEAHGVISARDQSIEFWKDDIFLRKMHRLINDHRKREGLAELLFATEGSFRFVLIMSIFYIKKGKAYIEADDILSSETPASRTKLKAVP